MVRESLGGMGTPGFGGMHAFDEGQESLPPA